MSYNFNEIISRNHSHSLKWDFTKERFGKEGLLPLWVADMDFKSSDAIVDAITARAAHGIYGYTDAKRSLSDAFVKWMATRHQTTIFPEWYLTSPGVVTSVNTAIIAFTKPGDKVLLQTPIYYPFYESIRANGRELVTNPLKSFEEGYEMDFEDLEEKFKKGVTLMVLCSPHNPIGRVWSENDLRKIAALCRTYDVILAADEIHCDLVFSAHKHFSVLRLLDGENDKIVLFNSPTKTFNIAGLSISNAVIPNRALRKAFTSTLHASGADMMNIFGYTAAIAAYTEGAPWLDELLPYLETNYEFLENYLKENIPEIVPFRPNATYLVWLDCRNLPIASKSLKSFFVDQAGVALNDGEAFGNEGIGFQRLNFACPKETLVKALEQIYDAVQAIRTTT